MQNLSLMTAWREGIRMSESENARSMRCRRNGDGGPGGEGRNRNRNRNRRENEFRTNQDEGKPSRGSKSVS